MSGITISKKTQLSSRFAPRTRGYARANAALRNSCNPVLFCIVYSIVQRTRNSFKEIPVPNSLAIRLSVAEASPNELDEHILQRRLVLFQTGDACAERGQSVYH